jgi:mono/diheme cytochrome c family protein
MAKATGSLPVRKPKACHASQEGENMKHISFAMVLLIALTSSAGAQQPGDSQEGVALAQSVCAQCHAVRKGQLRSPNPMAPSFSNLAKWPGMTDVALWAWLQSPHRNMPDLVLDNDQRNNVITYILSLKTGKLTL